MYVNVSDTLKVSDTYFEVSDTYIFVSSVYRNNKRPQRVSIEDVLNKTDTPQYLDGFVGFRCAGFGLLASYGFLGFGSAGDEIFTQAIIGS